MKHRTYLLSLLIIFAMLLAACGGNTAEPTTAPEAEEPT